jgi:hypothetical protein
MTFLALLVTGGGALWLTDLAMSKQSDWYKSFHVSSKEDTQTQLYKLRDGVQVAFSSSYFLSQAAFLLAGLYSLGLWKQNQKLSDRVKLLEEKLERLTPSPEPPQERS